MGSSVDSASQLGTKFRWRLVWRWGEKLTDEECHSPGERARSPIRRLNEPVVLGCRRVRLAPGMSKIPPACGRIFFNPNPAELTTEDTESTEGE